MPFSQKSMAFCVTPMLLASLSCERAFSFLSSKSLVEMFSLYGTYFLSTSHYKTYDGNSSTVLMVANGNGLIYNGVQNTTYGSRPAILYSL